MSVSRIKAAVTVHPAFTIGDVDPRIYSGFIEHLGRAVYTGIYEPGHPEADEQGFRKDVLALVRELDMPLTRYPGGNFVSAYRWEDGVGPRDKRPKRLDYAWAALEPNTFGTNEFVDWCRKANTAPMMAVNLGTRGPAEAADMVEYCNHPSGTALSDLRREHGYERPHGIKTWCLGNEMDGPWQSGAKTAAEYGRIAAESAKLMKKIDPSIELAACGSSSPAMPTFGAWETEVLRHTMPHVDLISLHRYFSRPAAGSTADFLAYADDLARYIQQTAAVCDAVSAERKTAKRINLSLDEWNCWYHSRGQESRSAAWTAARPLLEDIYTFEDALVNASALNTIINNADRVKAACIAQTVNVIAPIMADAGGRAWRQTIFWPQYYASRYGRGTVLRQSVSAPSYRARPDKSLPEVDASYLSSAVIMNSARRETAVFAVNRHTDAAMELTVDLSSCGVSSVIESIAMTGDRDAVNSADHESVRPERAAVTVKNGILTAELPALSWSMIRLSC